MRKEAFSCWNRQNWRLILLALAAKIAFFLFPSIFISFSLSLAPFSQPPTYFGFCPPGIHSVYPSFCFLFLPWSNSLFPSSELASSFKTALFSEINQDWVLSPENESKGLTWRCSSSWPSFRRTKLDIEYSSSVEIGVDFSLIWCDSWKSWFLSRSPAVPPREAKPGVKPR